MKGLSRFTDWIWHITGSVALAPGQSTDAVFDKLDPLFRQRDTSCEVADGTLTFRKRNQAPQDKMAIFDSGVLWVEQGPAGGVLRYRMRSRALLFCFLAPLLFLAFGQLTVVLAKLNAPAESASKKADKPEKALPQHPIDKALGAPAPEKPKKKDPAEKVDDEPPMAAYVFAGLFALLYAGGRILEDRLINALFQKRLRGGWSPELAGHAA